MMTADRPGRLRRYWQGLLIAAAVSYGQLHDTGGANAGPTHRHPYVWMLPDEPSGLDPLEVVGPYVLTIPVDAGIDRTWN